MLLQVLDEYYTLLCTYAARAASVHKQQLLLRSQTEELPPELADTRQTWKLCDAESCDRQPVCHEQQM